MPTLKKGLLGFNSGDLQQTLSLHLFQAYSKELVVFPWKDIRYVTLCA